MTPHERSIHALRALVRFDLLQAAANVVEAARLTLLEEQAVTGLTQRCETGASGIREASARSPLNPELVRAMQRSYRFDCQVLHDSRNRLSVARQREEQTRATLAALRSRERSLDEALLAQRRKSKAKQERLDVLVADDLWLQNAWRVQS